jgi:serine/threonine protein kinase, bacterial
VYALACVLHECLTGNTPYPGDSLEQQYAGHVATPLPRPSSFNPNLPAEFDRVTDRGLAKDPDQRYATPVELARAARDATTVPTPRPMLNPGPMPNLPTPPPTWPASPPPAWPAASPAHGDVRTELSEPSRRGPWRRRTVIVVEIVLGLISLLYLVISTGFLVRDTAHVGGHRPGLGAAAYAIVVV